MKNDILNQEDDRVKCVCPKCKNNFVIFLNIWVERYARIAKLS